MSEEKNADMGSVRSVVGKTETPLDHCGQKPISRPFGYGWIICCRNCDMVLTGEDEGKIVVKWNEDVL
ncbi:MAG: hypothetical protein ACE5EE_11455 [Fidelibacterota bacterium]